MTGPTSLAKIVSCPPLLRYWVIFTPACGDDDMEEASGQCGERLWKKPERQNCVSDRQQGIA